MPPHSAAPGGGYATPPSSRPESQVSSSPHPLPHVGSGNTTTPGSTPGGRPRPQSPARKASPGPGLGRLGKLRVGVEEYAAVPPVPGTGGEFLRTALFVMCLLFVGRELRPWWALVSSLLRFGFLGALSVESSSSFGVWGFRVGVLSSVCSTCVESGAEPRLSGDVKRQTGMLHFSAAPPAPKAPVVATGPPPDRGALLSSIQGGLKLRPTKTVDKSGPGVSGRVLDADTNPPPHIGKGVVEPPAPAVPETIELNGGADHSRPGHSSHQSVDWMSSRAAEGTNEGYGRMPGGMLEIEEKDEQSTDDEKEYDMMNSVVGSVPRISVGEHEESPVDLGATDLMSDIDKGVEYRVRTLYAYEGEGADDLSFPENVILIANPSKSGGDWWFGQTVKDGKSGLFPKTYVDVVKPVKAKALYSYDPANADEIALEEGETVDVIDTSEEEWYKVERNGTVLVAPAAYLELMESKSGALWQDNAMTPTAESHRPGIAAKHDETSQYQAVSTQGERREAVDVIRGEDPHPQEEEERSLEQQGDDSPSDSDEDDDSDYLSFDEANNEDVEVTEEELMARERERQMVLEAAGLLIVQRSASDTSGPPPPPPPRRVLQRKRSRATAKSKQPAPDEVHKLQEVVLAPLPNVEEEQGESEPSAKRRPPPATPARRRPKRLNSNKDLPPLPPIEDIPTQALDHTAQLDDAYARYEAFRNSQLQQDQVANNRLSVISTDSAMTTASSFTLVSLPDGNGPHRSDAASINSKDDHQSHRHSRFLNLLRSKTPEPGSNDEVHPQKKLVISGPMVLGSHLSGTASPGAGSPLSPKATAPSPLLSTTSPSFLSIPASPATLSVGSIDGGMKVAGDESLSPSRGQSPGFGSSWASLIDKTALEGIPPNERKRQEAIFELINTEVAYVRDLQLIVEVFYSSMLEVLSQKEITVVFANIEDILLTNTAFLSSLEERQKECRLYIDKIGDIILDHMPNMGVYLEYCVNQNTANKVLQSLKQNKPELIDHLNKLKENPAVRNLDLSSYLLEPMQRITRYPLLIKQIAHYTAASESVDAAERNDITKALDQSEKLLGSINESIRDQEGEEVLKQLSAGGLWIGQGRLDLTAPTRYMGPRKLLKQGVVFKAKSGRKLRAYLCSDILVLTDETGRNLYRMPIPLTHAQVKELPPSLREGDHAFQISQPYPRGGDSINLRAGNAKECKPTLFSRSSFTLIPGAAMMMNFEIVVDPRGMEMSVRFKKVHAKTVTVETPFIRYPQSFLTGNNNKNRNHPGEEMRGYWQHWSYVQPALENCFEIVAIVVSNLLRSMKQMQGSRICDNMDNRVHLTASLPDYPFTSGTIATSRARKPFLGNFLSRLSQMAVLSLNTVKPPTTSNGRRTVHLFSLRIEAPIHFVPLLSPSGIMSLSPEQAAALIDAISTSKYAACASITVLWFEHITSFHLEVKHMWTRGITIAKALYFIARYYVLIHSLLWVTYHADETLSGKRCNFPFTRNSCEDPLHSTQASKSPLIESPRSFFHSFTRFLRSYVRVYAFSGRNKYLLGFLSAAYLAVSVVTFYYLDRFAKSVSFLDLPPEARLGCFPSKADGFALTVIEITLLLSLTIATVIMIYIAVQRRKTMGAKNGLLQTFYQDGIYYFISISVLAVMNIFIFLLAPGGMQLLIVQPQVHFSGLLATRMLLHLREWSAKQSQVVITSEFTRVPGFARRNLPISEEHVLSDFTIHYPKRPHNQETLNL
ncbi:hypothetical protein NMY22_g11925 [Coprinellus aureogranulatus]|nr:hypothetical protein NMY22_g11925 [Coprinellus aureogranulatus]